MSLFARYILFCDTLVITVLYKRMFHSAFQSFICVSAMQVLQKQNGKVIIIKGVVPPTNFLLLLKDYLKIFFQSKISKINICCGATVYIYMSGYKQSCENNTSIQLTTFFKHSYIRQKAFVDLENLNKICIC